MILKLLEEIYTSRMILDLLVSKRSQHFTTDIILEPIFLKNHAVLHFFLVVLRRN